LTETISDLSALSADYSTSYIDSVVKHVYVAVVDGLATDVLDEGNVIYTTMHIVNEDTIRLWALQWRALRNIWQSDRIMYAATEFPGFTGTLLNFGLAQAHAVVRESKDVQSYSALVVPRTLAGQMVAFAVRAARFVGREERLQVFHAQQDAVRWLRACRIMEERKASILQKVQK